MTGSENGSEIPFELIDTGIVVPVWGGFELFEDRMFPHLLGDPYSDCSPLGDVDRLEGYVPVERDVNFRIAMTVSCRDCDDIPKVPGAGSVIIEGGEKIQLMHNGIRVLADGYYGGWMTQIISALQGHHEPQEERVFHEVLQHLDGNPVMVELGGFWSYYSLWFMKEHPTGRAFVVEPDSNYISIGRKNAELNRMQLNFTQGFVAADSGESVAFQTETAGLLPLRKISVPRFMEENAIEKIDVLHCDTQGAELDVVRSCRTAFTTKKIKFAFLSTHAEAISGDPLTHQRCLALLRASGAQILAEHDVHESFSGDGLIVAYFGPSRLHWSPLRLSYNRYSTSLFRNPLVDLALARQIQGRKP